MKRVIHWHGFFSPNNKYRKYVERRQSDTRSILTTIAALSGLIIVVYIAAEVISK